MKTYLDIIRRFEKYAESVSARLIKDDSLIYYRDKMLKEKELIVLSHLQENARKSIANISEDMGVPTSTVFDIIRRLEKKNIKKYVSLVDFSKIGYMIRISFIVKDDHLDFFKDKVCVNNMFKLNGSKLLVECVFKDVKDQHEFYEILEGKNIYPEKKIHMIDDIKREAFSIQP